MSIAVANLKRTVAHEAVTEHFLVRRAHRLRFNEAVGEVRADELRPGTTGECLDGGIDVVDLPVNSDRHERVEARLEQASVVDARQSDFASDRFRFRRVPFGQLRQLARRDGGDEKCDERDPILRIRNRQRVDRRQEEEVEAQDSDNGSHQRGPASPYGCDEEHHQQVRQGDSRVVQRFVKRRTDRGDEGNARDRGCEGYQPALEVVGVSVHRRFRWNIPGRPIVSQVTVFLASVRREDRTWKSF